MVKCIVAALVTPVAALCYYTPQYCKRWFGKAVESDGADADAEADDIALTNRSVGATPDKNVENPSLMNLKHDDTDNTSVTTDVSHVDEKECQTVDNNADAGELATRNSDPQSIPELGEKFSPLPDNLLNCIVNIKSAAQGTYLSAIDHITNASYDLCIHAKSNGRFIIIPGPQDGQFMIKSVALGTYVSANPDEYQPPALDQTWDECEADEYFTFEQGIEPWQFTIRSVENETFVSGLPNSDGSPLSLQRDSQASEQWLIQRTPEPLTPFVCPMNVVNIKSVRHGKYISTQEGGVGAIQSTSNLASSYERFVIVPVSGTSQDDEFMIKSVAYGTYFSATLEKGSARLKQAWECDDSEHFTFEQGLLPSQYTIRSVELGNFVSSQGGEPIILKSTPHTDEQWLIEQTTELIAPLVCPKGVVNIKSVAHGTYLSSRQVEEELICDMQMAADKFEQFNILPGSEDGHFVIRSVAHEMLLSIKPEDKDKVSVSKHSLELDDSEQFTFEQGLERGQFAIRSVACGTFILGTPSGDGSAVRTSGKPTSNEQFTIAAFADI